MLSSGRLNELRVQGGRRKFFEPTNSEAVSEWFSNGNTLQTGANILGDLLGEGKGYELRDTYHLALGGGTHDVKAGASILYHEERSIIDTFENGLFIYVTDTRALPLAYLYGEGSSDVTYDTTRYAVFVQDDWRPRPNLSVNLGVRYDLDDGGNNPGFTHPLVPKAREKDTDDVQPRAAFSYDPGGKGRDVFRGGAGLFNGRYLLVPAGIERQQNGVTGRVSRTRVNGALLGLNFPPFVLDPNNPTNTGVLLPPDISLLDADAGDARVDPGQRSAGPRRCRAASSSTPRWSTPRGTTRSSSATSTSAAIPTPRGRTGSTTRSTCTPTRAAVEYKALILRLNGNLRQSDLVTASFTLADKKNISDDFSPEFPFGYPNDPADIDAEYGRSRSDERYRFVLTGIFRMPWGLTLAPIYEYGSGQPWNHRLGYDFNGDGKNSDRPAGVDRNSEDGPPFRQLSLRLTKGFSILGDQRAGSDRRGVQRHQHHQLRRQLDRRRGVPLRPDAGEPERCRSGRIRTSARRGRRCRAARSSSACGGSSRDGGKGRHRDRRRGRHRPRHGPPLRPGRRQGRRLGREGGRGRGRGLPAGRRHRRRGGRGRRGGGDRALGADRRAGQQRRHPARRPARQVEGRPEALRDERAGLRRRRLREPQGRLPLHPRRGAAHDLRGGRRDPQRLFRGRPLRQLRTDQLRRHQGRRDQHDPDLGARAGAVTTSGSTPWLQVSSPPRW